MVSQEKIRRLVDDKITEYWDFDSNWIHDPNLFLKRSRDAISKPLSPPEKAIMYIKCILGNHNWVYVGRSFFQVGVCCNICEKRKLYNLYTGVANKILKDNKIPINEIKAINDSRYK